MKILLSTAAVALALAGAANAVTVTYSYSIASTPVPFTSSFTLPSFVTSLGTLTNVEIEVDDTAVATVGIYNANLTAQPFTNASASVPLTVTGPDGSSITQVVVAGPISGVANPGMNMFPGLSSSSMASLTTNAFSSYESATPQNLDFTAVAGSGTYTGTALNFVFFGGSAEAGGTVKLEYTYMAAPEPAAWALMFVGFGMMGGVLRRRSATAASI